MKKAILILTLATLISWPLSSLAISFNSREISGVVKITSFMAKESIDLQVRSLAGFFTIDEAAEYRKSLEEQILSGTGFFVTYSGCALTNKHVVYDEAAGAYNQDIHFWSSGNISAEPIDLGQASVVYYKNAEDLALVCLENTNGRFFNRVFVKTADYDSLKLDLGEQIYTLGYAENGNNHLTLTEGIISGKWDEETIMTTMPITAGASGSPIFNSSKQVVGMAQANTGPYDQLGLFLLPPLVINWYEEYQQVYREILPELSAGCLDTETRGVFAKDNVEYYDLACKNKRNFGLEAKVAHEYKSYCGQNLSTEDIVAAAGYIADKRSTVDQWQSYLESSCFSFPAEAVFVMAEEDLK